MSVEARIRKAQSLAKSGNVEEARVVLEALLGAHPANARARLALIRLDSDIKAANEPALEHMDRLALEYKEGRHAEALAAAKGLLRDHPKSVFLWNLLGTLCLKLADLAASEVCFKKAIGFDPKAADPLVGLAAVYQKLNRLMDAVACLELAVERNPRHLVAQRSLGALYSKMNCHDFAIEPFRRALDLAPDTPEGWYDCAATLLNLARHQETLQLLGKCVSRWPEEQRFYHLAAFAAHAAKDFPEAIRWSEWALRSQHDDTATLSILKAQQEMADWRNWASYADQAARLGRQTPTLSPGPILSLVDDPSLQRWHAERMIFDAPSRLPAKPIASPLRRLRVGYFSSDFEKHATMVLMAGLFEAHDRSRFEIFAYSYGKDCNDATRQRLLDAVEHFCDVRTMTDADIAAVVQEDGLDIAVDLKGYTEGSRSSIFVHRLAPVQISWLGWPGTMGHEAFDYAIVDRVTVPANARSGFTERLIYMPDSYQVNDDRRPVPEPPLNRKKYGLPKEGFIFCCFNATYKITPREFDIWMRLLSKVEKSVLWLLKTNNWAETNLRLEAERRGVSADRLVFASKVRLDEHIRRQGAANLFLDTFVINAHTTCSDALWGGLPVLTLPGRQFASRVGASLLRSVGLPELVAKDELDYERIALELAQDPERIRKLKRYLVTKGRTAPLFDTGRFARHLETAYVTAYEMHRQGKAPEDFEVTAAASVKIH